MRESRRQRGDGVDGRMSSMDSEKTSRPISMWVSRVAGNFVKNPLLSPFCVLLDF